MKRRVPTPLMIRLIIRLRIRPICSIKPLMGILSINGMKLWTLRRTPSWTTVIPLLVRNRLYMGWVSVKFSTKVVDESISAYRRLL